MPRARVCRRDASGGPRRIPRRTLSGEPFSIAEPVLEGPDRGIGNFSISDSSELAFASAGSNQSQLTWFDRSGRQIGTVAEPSNQDDPQLSPDASRIAVSRHDPETLAFDVWLLDLSRRTTSRVTFGPTNVYAPIWSPDGSQLVFTSNNRGAPDLYRRAITGAGTDDLILHSDSRKTATDWSRDGQFLVYTNHDPKTKADIWILPLTGDHRPVAYFREIDILQVLWSHIDHTTRALRPRPHVRYTRSRVR